jgi:hypothetical protein
MLRFEDLRVNFTEVTIPSHLGYFGIISAIDREKRTTTVHWKLNGKWNHYAPYPESVLNNDYFTFSNPNSIKAFLLHGTPVDLNKVFH